MIKTCADLFEAAAKMMRMCDEVGIPHTFKIKSNIYTQLDGRSYVLSGEPDMYEFPLAIVEGKPVFVGDVLFDKINGNKFYPKALDSTKSMLNDNDIQGKVGHCIPLDYLTWNPPKPKTVMVELLREDAEEWARQKGLMTHAQCRTGEACRKALEK